jgi:regulator of replication initiation timing
MAMKTEDGKQYPPSAYLYVPDPDKPSTWKLRIWDDPEKKITVAQLGRAAAALGPGFRGNRVELEPDERRAAARKLIRLYREQGVEDEEIPEYLWEIAGMRKPTKRMSVSVDDADDDYDFTGDTASDQSTDDYVEREALVFEAGEYPDKGITVTERDIERLASASGEVPVYVEHAESPIRLGVVKQFIARGKQLWARIRLHREADALLQKLGVSGLSVAVPRTLEKVLEVSVTGFPRIASARLFSSGIVLFAFGEQPPTKEHPRTEVSKMDDRAMEKDKEMAQDIEQLKQQVSELFTENEKLRAQLAAEQANRERIEMQLKEERTKAVVDSLVNAGKLPPALRQFAIALGVGAQNVQFAEGRELGLFEAFVELYSQQPPIFGSKLQGAPRNADDEELKAQFRAMGLTEKEAEAAVKEYKKLQEVR